MAVFKHGNTWWFEYRTRKPLFRVVKSTGFRVDDPKGLKKAEEVFAAFKLGLNSRPKRSAMEGVLDAIYDGAKYDRRGIAVSSIWAIYEDWCHGKGRKVSRMTYVNRRNLFERFAKYAEKHRCQDISDVTVPVARDFILSLERSNKTQRTYAGYLSQVWTAVGQMTPGIHNPWPAACPDNDGSSVRKNMFSEKQVDAILAEADRVGHGWGLVCRIALNTGLRYGNIATMEITDIDFERWIFTGIHNKTKRSSGAEIFIPVAETLKPLLAPFKGGEGFLIPEHGIKYTAGRVPQPLEVPFSDILKAVGIDGKQYGFHSFRHTANSRMAEAGVPSEVRQILCGWSNDAMARHYDHSQRLGELKDAIAKIGG